MATRAHTHADFNAASRRVEAKLEIYFDATPIVVSYDDLMIDMNITEEMFAESANPVGAVSANELSFTLLNSEGTFAPSNAEGPYYGKIKNDVKVKPFIRLLDSVDTLEWIPMGVFYVRDWKATVTGSTAVVYATDILGSLFQESTVDIQIKPGLTVKEFTEYIFATLGYSVTVDASLTDVIPYSFTQGKPGSFLTELMTGAMALCYCDRSGNIVVEPFTGARTNEATLTDLNQVITVESNQSILKTYDGIDFTYVLPQLTHNQKLLSIPEFDVTTGQKVYPTLEFDNGPIAMVGHVALQTVGNTAKVVGFEYTPWDIALTINNVSGGALVSVLDIYGTLLALTEINSVDSGSNLLVFKNRYIQTDALAATQKALLNTFVSSDIPVLRVIARGDLVLNIGDKVTISSTMHKLNFTGVIQRMVHKYRGSLGCELTLLNSEVVSA